MNIIKTVVNTLAYAFLTMSAIVGAFVIGCGIGVWIYLAKLTIIWYK